MDVCFGVCTVVKRGFLKNCNLLKRLPFFVLPILIWILTSKSLGKMDPLGLSQLIFFFLIFVFDTTASKGKFIATLVVALVFNFGFESGFSYSPFLIVLNGLCFWLLGAYFTSGLFFKMAMVLGYLFAIVSLAIFFHIFEIKMAFLSQKSKKKACARRDSYTKYFS